MTSDLNAYLKEYCMSEGFERLKQELETCKEELTGKVVTLETELAGKEASHQDRLRSLAEEHDEKVASLNEKLEKLSESFESERVKIEQLAQDQVNQLKINLDTTLAEKGELQKQVHDKIEAHEKQLQLQKSIDQLNKILADLQTEKVALTAQLSAEREERDRMGELHRQTEAALIETTSKLKEKMEAEKE